MGLIKKAIVGVVIYTACRAAGCAYDKINNYSRGEFQENIGQTATYVGDQIKQWGENMENSSKEKKEKQKPSKLENELEPEIPISEAIDIE